MSAYTLERDYQTVTKFNGFSDIKKIARTGDIIFNNHNFDEYIVIRSHGGNITTIQIENLPEPQQKPTNEESEQDQ